MAWIGYVFFRLLIALFAMLPFSWLYRLSDFVSWLLYNVIRYRRDTVYHNLRRAFPKWTDQEVARVARLSYTNLSDVLVETIKGFSFSTAELMQRYQCLNVELLNAYHKREQSVITVAAHYANWEWGLLYLPNFTPFTIIGIYKPLANKYVDQYVREKRMRQGLIFAATRTTSQTFEQYRSERTLTLLPAIKTRTAAPKPFGLLFSTNRRLAWWGRKNTLAKTTTPCCWPRLTACGVVTIRFRSAPSPTNPTRFPPAS